MPAGQRNASSTAGSADGISNNQHLLDTMLKKHDKLAEAFENREKTSRPGVSATTTKKKGIASTGASTSTVTVPAAGCNKDKCVEIKTPTDAIDGNCVNPTLPNGEPDYSMKYCAAFRPKDYTIDAQECLTCGYYGYTANCVKYDNPTNPTKCLLYGNYSFKQPTGTKRPYIECDADDAVCKLLAQQSGGGGQGVGYTGTYNAVGGQANSGSGGGGANATSAGSGGSGRTIISYSGSQAAVGGTVTSSGGNTIHTFTGDGTFTANASAFFIN